MRPELITPLSIGAGVVAGGAILNQSLFSVGPSEIAVRFNRITGERRPLLDRKRTVVCNAVIERPGWELGVTGQGEEGGFVRGYVRIERDLASLIMKRKGARYERLLAEHGIEAPEGRFLELRYSPVTVIEGREMPAPRQGLLAKIPFVHQVTRIPWSHVSVDPSEVGLRTRMTMTMVVGGGGEGDGKRISLTGMAKPDFTLSFRLIPSKTHEIIERYPRAAERDDSPFDQFKAAVVGLARAAAYQVVVDRDYAELTDLEEISQRGRAIFGQLLRERRIDSIVDVHDFTFQGVDLEELKRDINQAAGEALAREILGDELLKARILAGARSTVVAFPDQRPGLDQTTQIALLAKLAGEG